VDLVDLEAEGTWPEATLDPLDASGPADVQVLWCLHVPRQVDPSVAARDPRRARQPCAECGLDDPEPTSGDRAATEREVEQSVTRHDRRSESEVGLHDERLADAPGADDIALHGVRRQEARADRFHQEQPFRARRRDHVAGLTREQCQRLPAEHVLAGAERGDSVRRVASARRGHVHDVATLRPAVHPVTLGGGAEPGTA
jgi:hypothetical protein